MSSVINALVAEFVAKVWDAVEVEIYEKLVTALKVAMPGAAGRDVSRWTPFREAKPGVAAALDRTKSGRPKQMCPVPGCDGVAAPLYGMVCGQHKNVAKSKISKYRKDRKLKMKAKLLLNSMYGRTDLPISDKQLALVAKKPRKSPPKQFCPVPNCKGVAAPIFGMVCGEHKNVAKSKIAKYRKARKAAKLAGAKSVKTPAKKADKSVDKSVDKLPDKKLDKRTAKLTGSKGGKTVGGKSAKKLDKSPDKKSDKKAARQGATKVVKKVVQKAAKKAPQKTVSKVPQKRRKRPLKLGDVVKLKTVGSETEKSAA